jgi:hypothetical protein
MKTFPAPSECPAVQADPSSEAFGAYGAVLIVPLEDLPAWCLDHLGGEPAGVLFRV